MIRLKAELFDALAKGGREAVCCALQHAIELEHSTIPLYLYARYSLDRKKNREIYNLMRGIVIQEMQHMGLVCNILNALGGDPLIDHPKAVPRYPGPLPGGVESDLYVHLAPFSMTQLETFIKIEGPEHPLEFRTEAIVATPPQTIGQFYAGIKKQILALNDTEFVTPPRNQVGQDNGNFSDGIEVRDKTTAVKAIDLIVLQGEGTCQSPLDAIGSQKFAHYYIFTEIQKGKTLKENPNPPPGSPADEKYIYGAPDITLDPTGLYPMPTDPKAGDYAPGEVRRAVETFNYTYTNILKLLQAAFGGQPDQLQCAVNMMRGMLDDQAKKLVAMPANGGPKPAPTFEYQPFKPT